MTMARQRVPFRRTLTEADLWDPALEVAAGRIAPQAGIFLPLARLKVPPQQEIGFGFGSPDLPDNQGYLLFALRSSAADATKAEAARGKVRLVLRNAVGTTQLTVAEYSVAELSPTVTGTTDRRLLAPLPDQEMKGFPVVGEDSFLEIHYAADGIAGNQASINLANQMGRWRVPVTVWQ